MLIVCSMHKSCYDYYNTVNGIFKLYLVSCFENIIEIVCSIDRAYMCTD